MYQSVNLLERTILTWARILWSLVCSCSWEIARLKHSVGFTLRRTLDTSSQDNRTYGITCDQCLRFWISHFNDFQIKWSSRFCPAMAKIGGAIMVDASHQVPMLESPLLSVINKINSVPGCYWYLSGLSFHNGRKLYEAAFRSSSTARIFKLSTLHHSSSFSCPLQVQCISGVHSIYHSTCIHMPFHFIWIEDRVCQRTLSQICSCRMRFDSFWHKKIQTVENHTLAGKQIKKMFVANLWTYQATNQ